MGRVSENIVYMEPGFIIESWCEAHKHDKKVAYPWEDMIQYWRIGLGIAKCCLRIFAMT